MEFSRRTTIKVQKILHSRRKSFMFTKKSGIIKKIWKFSKLSSMLKEQSQEVHELKRKIHTLFKTLNEEQLDILLKTVQSNGGIESNCICVNSYDFRYISRRTSNFDPRITLAQAFRFPQMKDEFLRILPCCISHNLSGESICINPYHSSLVIDSEPPLPPYSALSSSITCHPGLTGSESPDTESSAVSCSSVTHDSSISSCKSLEKDISLPNSDRNWFPPWCRITYWEEKNRIGRIFDATEDCINVFETLPQGGGLCLSLLSQKDSQNTSSQKVKEHIGYGFQLTREHDGIWLYNRSEIVLFVGSPTIQLESVTLTQPVVKRLPPGTSVLVYDPNLASDLLENIQIQEEDGLSSHSSSHSKSQGLNKNRPFCVRVSFEKGWGKNYTRMSITQCPCWVEIYLNV